MIVNFAVKQQGLEAQLLNTVVKQERAELDRQKNELVVKVAQGKRTQVCSPTPGTAPPPLLVCTTSPVTDIHFPRCRYTTCNDACCSPSRACNH